MIISPIFCKEATSEGLKTSKISYEVSKSREEEILRILKDSLGISWDFWEFLGIPEDSWGIQGILEESVD